MNLAFVLFRYFPYGGLQRDMVRIARACQARGHQVRVWAMETEGELPADLAFTVLPPSGFSNHVRCRRFAQAVQQQLPDDALVVGFNRMPGLAVYFAADACFEARARQERPAWYRWLPRYRGFAALERAVFAPEAGTEILLIAAAQRAAFQRWYGTPDARFHLLPPGLERNRMAPPSAEAAALRQRSRTGLGLDDASHLVLMLGSGFRTKGLDRAIKALAALPDDLRSSTLLAVVGQDQAAPFQRLAASLGVAGQVQFLGGRDDVPELLQGADLLLHPAYAENTGTVLLEAVVAGLPVLATAVCGYAGHIEQAQAGTVLPEPFAQPALDRALASMLLSPERSRWRAHGIAYGRSADLYSMATAAADVIAATGAGTGTGNGAGRGRLCSG